jgi:heparosan-N-sulfate-glucuronate 5-epimerase
MTFPEVLPKAIFSADKEHIVTKEFNSISIVCNDFDVSSELGSYYLDMSEAFLQYDSGIFGDFDKNGVPMVGWGAKASYSSVNIAQYGFIIHDFWLKTKRADYLEVMEACLAILISLESNEEKGIFFRETHESDRYKLPKNWVSAMAQGECLSFYLRMFQILNDDTILQKCHLIFNAMMVPVSENGVKTIDENGFHWLEEYPSTPASYVLNGFIYAIFGIQDYYRVTKSEIASIELKNYFNTLEHNIENFDAGFWSYYDLQYKELVKFYYQKNVHAPQMQAMYRLTGNQTYNLLYKKWLSQCTKANFLFVQVMYRVLPRWNKLKKLWKR